MTNKKVTKRALIASALALVLCVSMFVGSTFAWFTDSVSSMNNVIKSGNLDVVLEYKNAWGDAWTEVDGNKPIFDENALYEPGYTEVVFLRVSNAGSLALKYQLGLQVISEKASTNVDGEQFYLSDYIEAGAYIQDEYSSGANYADVLMPYMFGSRAAALSSVNSLNSLENVIFASDKPVLPGDDTAQIMAIVLHMPEEVDNVANHLTGVAAPEINLGIDLVATQLPYESDSFGSDYDVNAEYPQVIISEADLKNAADEGGEYILAADIQVSDVITVEDDLVINLAGYSIDASNNASRPFELADGADLTINGDDEVVAVGAYGLVNIPAGNDAELVLNGGTYVGNTANGSFIKPRGDGEINITLNDVNYVDTSDNGYIFDASSYTGDSLTLTVNGGTYEAKTGFIVSDGSINDATITSHASKNMQPAVYATGDFTIEGCTINSTHNAVSVSNGATLTVKECEINVPAGVLALQVYSSGGTIDCYNTTYTGKYGTSGKMNSGKVALIYMDGVEVFRKG